VEDDLDGLDVGGHDDKLADTSVKRLGRLVGTVPSAVCPQADREELAYPFLSCL
jgi:hypothetical protein